MKPVRIRHAKILAEAHAALARGGREAEAKRAHRERVLEKARGIVARHREEDRLRRCARLSAHKAILLAKDAFAKISASTSSDVDQQHWRERQEIVERELREIVTRTSR